MFDAIIAPFGIGFAPYVINDSLTEFINPDKYYLYLNSGMEVISTDIPQARRLADRIHIARSPREIVDQIARIQSDPSCRKNRNSAADYSWERRADELLEVIQFRIRGDRA